MKLTARDKVLINIGRRETILKLGKVLEGCASKINVMSGEDMFNLFLEFYRKESEK